MRILLAGHYMQVEVRSVSAIAGMVVSMTTPGFILSDPHCLTFDYKVMASSGDTPILEIHTRMTDYMLSGKRLWTSQDYNRQHSKASIALSVANGTGQIQYVLDFVGILAEPESTLIRISNVEFLVGQCKDEGIISSTDEDSGIVMNL